MKPKKQELSEMMEEAIEELEEEKIEELVMLCGHEDEL
jgi:hypothetical protein